MQSGTGRVPHNRYALTAATGLRLAGRGYPGLVTAAGSAGEKSVQNISGVKSFRFICSAYPFFAWAFLPAAMDCTPLEGTADYCIFGMKAGRVCSREWAGPSLALHCKKPRQQMAWAFFVARF